MRTVIAVTSLLLLTGCASSPARVGVFGHDRVNALPTVVIVWCGDDGPAQVDVRSYGIDLHYRANRPFDGGRVEVDLMDPGPDWSLERGVVSGGRSSGMIPLTDNSLLTVTVSTAATEGDTRGEGDLGETSFLPRDLRPGLVYRRADGQVESVALNEFTANC